MKTNNAMKPKLKLLTKSISLALLASTTHSAHAADIEIDDECSLIEAIQAANTDSVVGGCEAGVGDDVIRFNTPDTTINLTKPFGNSQIDDDDLIGLPTITSHVTIEGNGLTISKDDPDLQFRLLEVSGYRFANPQTASLHIKNTTLTGGNTGFLGTRSSRGGAMFANHAGLHLENCQFIKNNNALFVYRSADTVIEHSVFRDNKTHNAIHSSTIVIRKSNAQITHTSVVNNRKNFTYLPFVYGPSATLDIYASNVTVSNSTFSGNNNKTYGAILVDSGSTTFAPSHTSPLLGNQIAGQGSDYQVTISNSTITGNTADVSGGILSITETQYGSLVLSGNIISGNVALLNQEASNLNNRGNNLTLEGNNIFGEHGNDGVSNNVTLGESDRVLQTATSELLYPLMQSNDQFVHPLKGDSVAVDAISGTCGDQAIDQEGSPRILDGNGDGMAACDIGASEKTPEIVVDANCNLNDAILAANSDAAIGACVPGLGADVIQLPRNSQQQLTAVAATMKGTDFGLPLISSAVMIEGNNSTINRDSNAPDFAISGIEQGGDLALINSHVTNGSGVFAGLLSDQGNISLLNTTISQMDGVALLNSYGAKMVIENSSIYGNNIPQDALTLDIGNGAIFTDNVRITGSSFHNNSGGKGAALDLRNNAYSSLKNSTISTNTSNASSAFVIEGSAKIYGLTVTNNSANIESGGAYFLTEPFDAAYSESKSVIIRNSIFSGNTINQPNYVSNTQHGVASTTEIFNVENGGLGVRSFNNIFGQNNNAGVGIIEIDTDSMVLSEGVETLIGPLQFNGGFNLSHAPVPSSLAIDNVISTADCFLIKDQANNIRPFDGDGDDTANCDIGAIESGSFNPNDLIFKNGFDD